MRYGSDMEHTSHDPSHTHGDHADHGEHVSHDDHLAHDLHDAHAGHGGRDAHTGHSENDHAGHGGHDHSGHVDHFRRLFWIMLALMIPTVAVNPMFAHLLGYSIPDVAWVRLISPALGAVIYFWGGWPFLSGAVDEIRTRKPAMMSLIALAITVAFLASSASTLGFLGPEMDFWWELALLTVIMLLGHWLEARSLAQTTSALDELAALLPDKAERVEGDVTVSVDPADLVVDDVVVVRPGGTIPADGIVVGGTANVDESMVTGESAPIHRSVGHRVVAGTVAIDSGLRVRVTEVGDATTLAGIQRLVADAQSSSSHTQRLADRAASWLFWIALAVATVAAVVWSIIDSPAVGLERAITTLIIACPHALGLAIPLVVAIATERSAKAGILIKDRLALEIMRDVDTVYFDKTGTLTAGSHILTAVESFGDLAEDEILAIAAAASADSEHPLSRAIVTAAKGRALALPVARDLVSMPSVGVTAIVGDSRVRVGGPRLLAEEGGVEPSVASEWGAQGATTIYLIVDGTLRAAFRMADAVRAGSQRAVEALQSRGVEVVMITGDNLGVANDVASRLGIDRVYADVRPEHKADKVAELQVRGRTVAMVGDGVNDAPALAQADVGIAIGAGTDVAIASADIVLASSDPRAVDSVFTLSTAAYKKMRQNLWWAAGYNIVALPLAAGVLAPHFTLPMSVGAILMSLSTIIVALNAQLLRRLDLTPR